jgi:hypothetical protein
VIALLNESGGVNILDISTAAKLAREISINFLHCVGERSSSNVLEFNLFNLMPGTENNIKGDC